MVLGPFSNGERCDCARRATITDDVMLPLVVDAYVVRVRQMCDALMHEIDIDNDKLYNDSIVKTQI